MLKFGVLTLFLLLAFSWGTSRADNPNLVITCTNLVYINNDMDSPAFGDVAYYYIDSGEIKLWPNKAKCLIFGGK